MDRLGDSDLGVGALDDERLKSNLATDARANAWNRSFPQSRSHGALCRIPSPWWEMRTRPTYRVAVEVHFLSASPAVIMGRIDSADVFQDGKARWPSSYILRVEPDGAWELLSAEFKKPVASLASGMVTLDRSQWHHLELRFVGKRIVASLDDSQLASVGNMAHTHGMFALGAGWDQIQFDNLAVAP